MIAYDDLAGKFYRAGEVPRIYYDTEREANMAEEKHPVETWQDMAAPLIASLNDMLTNRGKINEFFVANEIAGYILRGLAADPTGNGPMLDEQGNPVGTWTCLRAATQMHTMSNIEEFLQGKLQPAKDSSGVVIDGLPLLDVARWVAMRRAK